MSTAKFNSRRPFGFRRRPKWQREERKCIRCGLLRLITQFLPNENICVDCRD